jgi:hypothetical protein
LQRRIRHFAISIGRTSQGQTEIRTEPLVFKLIPRNAKEDRPNLFSSYRAQNAKNSYQLKKSSYQRLPTDELQDRGRFLFSEFIF